MAQRKSRPLTPGDSRPAATTLVKTFSKIRGTDAMTVGRTSPRFSMSLSMLSANAMGWPRRYQAALSTWAKLWASGRKISSSSSASTRAIWAVALASKAQFPWVSTTPLGGPVVPEV